MSYSILDLAQKLAEAGFSGTLFKDHCHPVGSIDSPNVAVDEVNVVLRRGSNLVMVPVTRALAAELGACEPLAIDWEGKPKVLGAFERQGPLPRLTEQQIQILRKAGDSYCVGPVTPKGQAWLEVFAEKGSRKSSFQGRLVTTLHLLPQSLVKDILETAGFTEPECTAVSIRSQENFSDLVAIGSHQGNVHNSVTPSLIAKVLEPLLLAEHPHLRAQLAALLSPDPWSLGNGLYTSEC